MLMGDATEYSVLVLSIFYPYNNNYICINLQTCLDVPKLAPKAPQKAPNGFESPNTLMYMGLTTYVGASTLFHIPLITYLAE